MECTIKDCKQRKLSEQKLNRHELIFKEYRFVTVIELTRFNACKVVYTLTVTIAFLLKVRITV